MKAAMLVLSIFLLFVVSLSGGVDVPYRGGPAPRQGTTARRRGTSSCAVAESVATIDIDQHCRRPSRLIHDADNDASAATHRRQQQISNDDGINRTKEGCATPDGLACDLCCNGKCCEDNDDTVPLFPSTVQAWIAIKVVVILQQSDAYLLPQDDLTRRLNDQLSTVNAAFVPKGQMFFYVNETQYVVDSYLASGCNTDECYQSLNCIFYSVIMKRYMANHERALTLVLCNLGYLGEAQFPWADVERSPYHYIQVHAKIIGIGNPLYPKGRGCTLVHELGHYFGLLHVFEIENKCDVRGDYVDDTPAQGVRASQEDPCDTIRDSCPAKPGNDDFANFMNYANDQCMRHFSDGQYARMQRFFLRYRPKLLANSLVTAGRCPLNATNLSGCMCHAAEGVARLVTNRCLSLNVVNGSSGGASPTLSQTLPPELSFSPPRSPQPSSGAMSPPSGNDSEKVEWLGTPMSRSNAIVIVTVVPALVIFAVAVVAVAFYFRRKRRRSAKEGVVASQGGGGGGGVPVVTGPLHGAPPRNDPSCRAAGSEPPWRLSPNQPPSASAPLASRDVVGCDLGLAPPPRSPTVYRPAVVFNDLGSFDDDPMPPAAAALGAAATDAVGGLPALATPREPEGVPVASAPPHPQLVAPQEKEEEDAADGGTPSAQIGGHHAGGGGEPPLESFPAATVDVSADETDAPGTSGGVVHSVDANRNDRLETALNVSASSEDRSVDAAASEE